MAAEKRQNCKSGREEKDRGVATGRVNQAQQKMLEGESLGKQLQLLAGLEADGFAGCDADFCPGAWIATDAGLAWANGENAKAAQFYAFTLGESVLHAFKHLVDRRFRLVAREAGAFHDVVNNVELDHAVPFPAADGRDGPTASYDECYGALPRVSN